MADVTLNKSYKVAKKTVFISIRIGEGQFATSDVFLNSGRLVRASGAIGKLQIGGGPDIAGKDVLVRSVVNDVSSATNRMSITYRLEGGAKTEEHVAKGKVAKEGDLLIFEATFPLTEVAS